MHNQCRQLQAAERCEAEKPLSVTVETVFGQSSAYKTNAYRNPNQRAFLTFSTANCDAPHRRI